MRTRGSKMSKDAITIRTLEIFESRHMISMIQLEISCPKCSKGLCFALPTERRSRLMCPYCKTEFGTSTPAAGYLYALSNPSMPGLLKIGFTARSVEDRVSELDSSTATPIRFDIAFYFACTEPQIDEALAHEALNKHRLNESREFFKISEIDALSILCERLSRPAVFLSERLIANDYKTAVNLRGVDELLRNEVIQLRDVWSSTEGASKGISLLYRLISERRYSDAKKVVSLFLLDNPEHGVAHSLQAQIDTALMKEKA